MCKLHVSKWYLNYQVQNFLSVCSSAFAALFGILHLSISCLNCTASDSFMCSLVGNCFNTLHFRIGFLSLLCITHTPRARQKVFALTGKAWHKHTHAHTHAHSMWIGLDWELGAGTMREGCVGGEGQRMPGMATDMPCNVSCSICQRRPGKTCENHLQLCLSLPPSLSISPRPPLSASHMHTCILHVCVCVLCVRCNKRWVALEHAKMRY